MPKTQKIIMSFNSGELSPLMDPRLDQQKYASGCRIMENFIPLIHGAAQERSGLEYIAGQKSNSAKGRLVAFEHSVDDTYILLFENQVIRFFKNGAQAGWGEGTEDLSSVDGGALLAHWLLNDIEDVTVINDDNPGTYDGTASTAIGGLTTTGKVNGCFDLDGQYTVEIADAAAFSFTDNSNDSAFSIVCWAFITQQSEIQVLLSKWRDQNTAKEWRFSLNSEKKLQLHLADTQSDLSGDRVSQWKLNESAANTSVVDDVGLQNGVSSVNTSTLAATGKINGAFDFDTQHSVEINNNNSYNFGNGSADSAFSIAAWVYVVHTGNWQSILTKAGSIREWALRLFTTSELIFHIYDDNVNKIAHITTNDAISVGWHFVVATYDGTGGSSASDGLNLYIDGSLATNVTRVTETGYVAMESLTNKVYIGVILADTDSKTQYWSDKIDNVVLFDIELTQANISTLYNSGVGTESMPTREISAVADTALSAGWHFLVCTYNAPADETAAAEGMILYVDGVAVTSTKTEDADYLAMQAAGEAIRIGSQNNSSDDADEKFWGDKIDEVSIFSDVLNAAEVASLYTLIPLEITSPYLTADLPTLKFEQSADVMFITHPLYEPRKLSRFSDIVWSLAEEDLRKGPFRDQNVDTSKTITASATTGSIILTAAGHTPFAAGTFAGHEPSGSIDTSKSKTGALFKLVHASDNEVISHSFTSNTSSAEILVTKGVKWDFVTSGTWIGTIKIEREFGNSGVWETVHPVINLSAKNISTSGTEEVDDAQYRITMSNFGSGAAEVQFSIRDTSHIGIVEITSVTSKTVAIGTVLTTLADTTATHRWSEGSLSNRRGWPIDVTISSEERLTFAGNLSEPLTTWASVIGDFTDYRLGTDDDDALNLTLVGSGQQNRIRWILSKNVLIIGTVGGEHLLGASSDEEALTPSNIKAKLQTTYGSEDIAAIIVNQAVLFVQRGGRKIREFLYEFESDSFKADDLTVFAEHITESGIVNMAFQRTPDPMLWCVRDDGVLAVMTYERDQNVFSWARFITQTNLAGTKSDSDFESVAVIYGGAGNEDEVWVTVKRTIEGSPVRYVERFFQRKMTSALADMKYLDSYVTYTGGTTTATGLGHLIGQTVQVLGDGVVQSEAVSGDFDVTASGEITLPSTFTTVQIGLGYTSTVKPMKLDIQGLGQSATMKINRGVFNFFETIGGKVGGSLSTLQDIPTGTAALFTGSKEIPLRDGYSRDGDIIAQQSDPLPMTVLSFVLDVGINRD
ncbi:MAG: LamG-like jellyroll fold domain-containing protein [Candidatus Scalindua sp.]